MYYFRLTLLPLSLRQDAISYFLPAADHSWRIRLQLSQSSVNNSFPFTLDCSLTPFRLFSKPVSLFRCFLPSFFENSFSLSAILLYNIYCSPPCFLFYSPVSFVNPSCLVKFFTSLAFAVEAVRILCRVECSENIAYFWDLLPQMGCCMSLLESRSLSVS